MQSKADRDISVKRLEEGKKTRHKNQQFHKYKVECVSVYNFRKSEQNYKIWCWFVSNTLFWDEIIDKKRKAVYKVKSNRDSWLIVYLFRKDIWRRILGGTL